MPMPMPICAVYQVRELFCPKQGSNPHPHPSTKHSILSFSYMSQVRELFCPKEGSKLIMGFVSTLMLLAG